MTRPEQVSLTFTDADRDTLPSSAPASRRASVHDGQGPVLVPMRCPACGFRTEVLAGTPASHSNGTHERVLMVREEPTP